MDMLLKDRFVECWKKYFGEADMPIAFWYSADAEGTEKMPLPKEHRCFIGDLAQVRQGKAMRFDEYTVACDGAKRYLGFTDAIRQNFAEFLSCGIPGKVEGERYKKSPDLVHEFMRRQETFDAPDQYIVFKRFDMLGWGDDPVAVIFIAPPDVISGLFTLANFAEAELDGVISPFCAGCASIVQHPFIEGRKERPRAVLGMFDISARPFIKNTELSFAIPMKKFAAMVDDMDESFLATKSWKLVQRRIENVYKRG